MTKEKFLKLMRFPKEWESLGMYPEELCEWQISGYKQGHEEASEHDRNGAFHWWLRRAPSKDQLEKLLRLTFLDPDPMLGADVRTCIHKASAFDTDLAVLETKLLKGR